MFSSLFGAFWRFFSVFYCSDWTQSRLRKNLIFLHKSEIFYITRSPYPAELSLEWRWCICQCHHGDRVSFFSLRSESETTRTEFTPTQQHKKKIDVICQYIMVFGTAWMSSSLASFGSHIRLSFAVICVMFLIIYMACYLLGLYLSHFCLFVDCVPNGEKHYITSAV